MVFTLLSSSPWPWMCGPSGWGTPPCCGGGCPSCSPTQRSCALGHWYTGSGCPRHSCHRRQVGGWGGVQQGLDLVVGGSLTRPPGTYSMLPVIRGKVFKGCQKISIARMNHWKRLKLFVKHDNSCSWVGKVFCTPLIISLFFTPLMQTQENWWWLIVPTRVNMAPNCNWAGRWL